MGLLYDAPTSLLRFKLKESKSACNRDTCTPMFTIALFAIAKLWKPHKHPPTDEWSKKCDM
jgi:hypothetical protein